MYQPSEVVLLPFPFTDLSASKKRPVLILEKPNFQGDFLAVLLPPRCCNSDMMLIEPFNLDGKGRLECA